MNERLRKKGIPLACSELSRSLVDHGSKTPVLMYPSLVAFFTFALWLTFFY